MADHAPVTRFAPSPTGHMHLGNARTALFNALLARAGGGRFLLRVEDTDRDRSEAAFETSLLEDLRWLGLAWDPAPGHADGFYRQSERAALYAALFARLLEQGDAYPCFCTGTDLDRVRREQLAAGRPPRYPGTCRHLAPETVAERLGRGEPASLRFRVPGDETLRFDDLVRGPHSFASDDLGDFVIRRSDGTAAFLFSNGVDDALMGVTHVLRGEDHLSNTPRQLLVQRALGLAPPLYGHLPLIVGQDGAPLSKRHGSLSIRDLRAEGYLPGAVINYLARLGHHLPDENLLDLAGLGRAFGLAALGHAPARFDVDQLRHWQRAAVGASSGAALWEWLGAGVRALVPDGAAMDFIAAIRPNVVLPEDARYWATILFRDPLPVNPDAAAVLREAGPEFFHAAAAAWSAGDPGAFTTRLRQATGHKGRSLFHPLRVALTGEADGPELGRLIPLLGTARVAERLRRAGLLAAGVSSSTH
jgi:glutamyl-tRNA synthetase